MELFDLVPDDDDDDDTDDCVLAVLGDPFSGAKVYSL
jgi:hypothetical protein